jgi:protein-S-isoprenylcysteine O-methyltransferase Ste14
MLMLGIALGAASFFVVFWVDAVSLCKVRHVKPVLWTAASVLFAAGLVLACRDPLPFVVPVGLRAAGWTIGGVFFLLLVYSVFVEIPLTGTHARKGAPAAVVTRGTYALCRHPGVLWLAGFLGGMLLGTGSRPLLIAIPLWIGLDAVYVVLQEKLFFGRMFGAEYASYQRSVPMLFPTSQSIHECARTMFRRDRK